MIGLIKYSFWHFNQDNSGLLSGLSGQVTHAILDGVEFYTRENVNAVNSFFISSNERWGDKIGNKPRKERHNLELFIPAPNAAIWDHIADKVKEQDQQHRPVTRNKEFNQKWIDRFSKEAIWTWKKEKRMQYGNN